MKQRIPESVSVRKSCAYFKFLVFCGHGLGFFLPNRSWPDINNIEPTWKRLQVPLLKFLRSAPVIFTDAAGGKWLDIGEAIFDRLHKDDARELLRQVLFQARQNVATVPDHVIQCITWRTPDIHTPTISEVDPCFVRLVLKNTPSCYRTLGRMEKLSLLKFALKDGKFSQLLGLELLPLSDGTFASFRNSDNFAIYMSLPEHPAELLPGLQHRLLTQDVDSGILRKLQEVAEEGISLI